MEYRDDESAIKAGLELFYNYGPTPEPGPEQQTHDKGNAWAVIIVLCEYVGSNCFKSYFQRALEANEPWPVDVSDRIPSNSAEALSLEQDAVKALESRGFFVDPSIKKEWASSSAEKFAVAATRDSIAVRSC